MVSLRRQARVKSFERFEDEDAYYNDDSDEDDDLYEDEEISDEEDEYEAYDALIPQGKLVCLLSLLALIL